MSCNMISNMTQKSKNHIRSSPERGQNQQMMNKQMMPIQRMRDVSTLQETQPLQITTRSAWHKTQTPHSIGWQHHSLVDPQISSQTHPKTFCPLHYWKMPRLGTNCILAKVCTKGKYLDNSFCIFSGQWSKLVMVNSGMDFHIIEPR